MKTKPTKIETPTKANGTSTTKVTPRVKPLHNLLDLDDLDNDDDIFSADFKKSGKARGDDYEEGTDDEDEPILPRKQTRGKDPRTKLTKDVEENDVDMKDDDDFVVPDDDEAMIVDKPAKSGRKRGSTKKRKSDDLEDDNEETPKKGKGKRVASNKSTPAKKKAKKEDVPENAEMQAIFDSIPTVRPPTPPPQDPNKKFNFAAYAGHATAQPVAAGAKERPIGAENCLAGLTFVFTGVLDTLGREEGQSLVKQYGGRVTAAPSKITSYVVLGNDAGPKKLQIIKQHNLKTINEDGLYELIRRLPANGGDSKAAAIYAEKKQKEEDKIKEMAAEIDQEEKKASKKFVTSGAQATTTKVKTEDHGFNDKLLTVKYAPTQLTQICGNKSQVEKLQNWLRAFHKNQQKHFKMAGKDGSGVFRAVILSGPPGIGKTTAAHLVAKLEGYDIVETNASDTRSKKLVEEGLRGILNTTSLLGYFAGDGQNVEASKKKLVLIMDEVDGMSAGDRGGVGALASICKKSDIPIILICNDRKLPKMRPFDHVTYDLPFRRPTLDQIRSRIMTIVYREGLKVPTNVVNALIEGSGADIRQVVNMISAAKLDQDVMDFEKGKQMSKAWEKHIILKPWDITNKILGGGMFAQSSTATLNDKIELYFNDHDFSFLMLQENYLGTNPIQSLNYQGKEKNLKILELVEKASESISDGDLVDRMIHGSQQHWSLMPTHAVFSFVRPASFVAGSQAGHQTRFTSWLGRNSTQGKLARMVKEIQGHMRLRSSGDRHEIRQQYIPVLWQQLVKRLQVEGKDAVPGIIELMDSYFLTRDDFDAITELGVGPMDMEKLSIQSQAKAAFTRKYNEQSHPLPFMKASNVVAPKKTTKDKPDLEEALEESDEGEVVDEAPDADEDETDLSKDKYIKAPKKKKAVAGSKTGDGKGKGKRSKKAADDDKDEDEDEPPTKKGKGKAKAKK
jgi:replication factor C subunit 1